MKPEDIPQEVWAAADAVGEAIHGRHERGFVMWPLISDAGEPPQEIVARAIMAATSVRLPKLDNCGTYLAKDNAGQWHYINHAGTWQGCPPPFPSVEDEREACAVDLGNHLMLKTGLSVSAIVDAEAAIRNRGKP